MNKYIIYLIYINYLLSVFLEEKIVFQRVFITGRVRVSRLV